MLNKYNLLKVESLNYSGIVNFLTKSQRDFDSAGTSVSPFASCPLQTDYAQTLNDVLNDVCSLCSESRDRRRTDGLTMSESRSQQEANRYSCAAESNMVTSTTETFSISPA